DAAYTGLGEKQLGSIAYRVDPGQITTNGGPSAPPLLVLALAPAAGAPPHDLPVLTTPQPSDTPADPATATVLDLTQQDGQLLGRDALTGDEPHLALYPVSLPASQLAPSSTPTAGGGSATPTRTAGSGGPVTPPAATTAPLPLETPLAVQLSLGAPEIDGNGRLIGMLALDGQGHRALFPLAAITRAVGPVSGRSG